MSCEATPAHASEPFEWRIRQRSRGLTCGSRASRRRRTALYRLDKRYTLVYHADMKELKYYKHVNGKAPVIEWLKGLDVSISRRINGRLTRIAEDDNFGDFKKLDDKISELRFNFGSGYRIYYSEVGDVIVLLLNAGDKKLQSRDIEKAREYLEIWRQNNE